METYIFSGDLKFEAWYFETSRSWGHKARAIYKGRELSEVKIVYQNRTWEAYKYQSVMQKLLDVLDEQKIVPLHDRLNASRMLKEGDGRDMKGLRMIGALAEVAGIIGGNKSKAKILESVPGIIMPDDFGELPEIEQSRRLDGAINILTK